MDPSFRIRRHELSSDSFSDSDWAVGRHFLRAFTRKQKIIASGSVRSERVQSMMCDLGFAVKPVLSLTQKQQSTFTIDRESGK